jgi:hypothetical protein
MAGMKSTDAEQDECSLVMRAAYEIIMKKYRTVLSKRATHLAVL